MKQPPGFLASRFPDQVCLLHKSFLYGLEQAQCAWYNRLSTYRIFYALNLSDQMQTTSTHTEKRHVDFCQ